jgi:tripartite-type tricarboxylate transporter receptor subunit TctC
MRIPRREFLASLAAVAALPTMSHSIRAETWPTRPITIIDTFPPGAPESSRE